MYSVSHVTIPTLLEECLDRFYMSLVFGMLFNVIMCFVGLSDILLRAEDHDDMSKQCVQLAKIQPFDLLHHILLEFELVTKH